MVVPLFLPPGAFEVPPSTAAKIPRIGFSISCILLLAEGCLSIVAGKSLLGMWQILGSLMCSLILRRTRASAILVVASIFGLEFVTASIIVIEKIPGLTYGHPPFFYRADPLILVVLLLRPVIALIFLIASLIYYYSLMKLYNSFVIPNLLFRTPGEAGIAEPFAGESHTLEDV